MGSDGLKLQPSNPRGYERHRDSRQRSSHLFCIWHLAPLNAVKLRWWHSAWHLRPSLGPFKSWECQGIVRETSPSSTWDTGMRRKVSDLTTSSLSWCLKLDARETSRWSMDLWNRLTSERSISLKCCPYLYTGYTGIFRSCMVIYCGCPFLHLGRWPSPKTAWPWNCQVGGQPKKNGSNGRMQIERSLVKCCWNSK